MIAINVENSGEKPEEVTLYNLYIWKHILPSNMVATAFHCCYFRNHPYDVLCLVVRMHGC